MNETEDKIITDEMIREALSLLVYFSENDEKARNIINQIESYSLPRK
ncbi:hypothetical protein [Brevibacillus sp. IT-7CA2]